MFNTKIDSLTMDETIAFILKSIVERKQIVHNSINANKIVLIKKYPLLKESLDEADIVNADGQSVIYASKWLGKPLPERVAGIDLMTKLLEQAYKNQLKVYLFGAKEEVVKRLINIINKQYATRIIAGYRNGYFQPEEENDIANEINKSGANILFVGIPSPKKENFIKKHRVKLSSVSLLMGVGGSFDVLSGSIKRAPKWMQKIGMEWVFRLLMEPRKMWKRYLIGNIKFIRLLFDERRNIKHITL